MEISRGLSDFVKNMYIVKLVLLYDWIPSDMPIKMYCYSGFLKPFTIQLLHLNIDLKNKSVCESLTCLVFLILMTWLS